MNETRKQIIELIEPYIDKTPNFGCYMKVFNGESGKYNIEQIVKIKDYNERGIYYITTTNGEWKGNGPKILGHYCITAVLKYIDKSGYYSLMAFHNTDKKIVVYECDENTGEIDYVPVQFSFPNKPLHLYTEQEDKELLELLKKL